MKAERRLIADPKEMPLEALELVAARFRAMGDATRLRILQSLARSELGVSAIAKLVGSTQPNISKHLNVLQDVGLIRRRQEGNTVYCSIADDIVFELCQLVGTRIHERLQAQVGALSRRHS